MNTRTIEAIHRGKEGKVSDKWESYLGYYDSLFAPLRDTAVSLLEVGVQNGGSLETWSEYFSSGQLFVGCDINPKCAALEYEDPRIKVVIANAVSEEGIAAIQSLSPNFDIIIDDGSHLSFDILNTFINYFPMLNAGGIYVIEDTHTLYGAQVGGGVLNEGGPYAFFKKLVDVVNFQFWHDQVALDTYFQTFFPGGSIPPFLTEGWIESIEFRNSIITIRKSRTATHDKLGARITAGKLIKVWDVQKGAPA